MAVATKLKTMGCRRGVGVLPPARGSTPAPRPNQAGYGYIQQDPNLSEAYELRGKIRLKMGDSQGAIADQQKAKAINDAQLE